MMFDDAVRRLARSLKLEGPDALAQLWAALATVDGGKE